jgi:hypothetical protein
MDSRPETWEHIHNVQHKLNKIIVELTKRAHEHDQSKLISPEVECFDEYTEKLKHITYGSEEYKKSLELIKPALDHHYAKNDHHVDHFPNGIKDMSLVHLVEMLCDWAAASERHHDGNIKKSIEYNQKRYNYSDELKQIFMNTLRYIEG